MNDFLPEDLRYFDTQVNTQASIRLEIRNQQDFRSGHSRNPTKTWRFENYEELRG
jgi:hypothetical protein